MTLESRWKRLCWYVVLALLVLSTVSIVPVAQAKALEGPEAAAWSPDGKQIAFTYLQENRPAIYMMAADGLSDPVKLAADATTSVWSPDGKYIAFTRGFRIYVLPVDRSGPERFVAEGYMPMWSPDGAQIMFFKIPGNLYVVNADSSKPVQITDLAVPEIWKYALSPDGKHLAFVTLGKAQDMAAIYVLNSDGSNMRKLDDAPADTHVSWSPDSRQLVVLSMCGGTPYLCILNADGSGYRRLTHGEGPVWSPDGKQIAFLRNGEMWVTAVDGSGERLLVSQAHSVAWWSPDSKRVLFRRMSQPKPGDGMVTSELYMIEANGSNLHKLPISVERLNASR